MKTILTIAWLAAAVSSAQAQKPSVSIIEPANGQTLSPGPVTLSVDARDTDGYVAAVEFYVDGIFTEFLTEPPFSTQIFCTKGRYKAQAIAYDNQGYFTESAPIRFQVGGEFGVNLLRGPYLQSCTATSIVVRWRTDWPTNSIVRFGTNTLDRSVTNHVPTDEHAVRLTGLTPGTRYLYSFGATTEFFDVGYPQTFVTAPTNAAPLTVWAIGDFGTGYEEQEEVRNAFLNSPFAEETSLWLMLGDNAYESGTDDEYQANVFDKYPMLFPSLPAWPTIGNHDAASPDGLGRIPYLDIFDLPVNGEAGGVASGTEKYYSFDHGNVHFICLDSQMSDRSSNGPMMQWLRADLADTAKDWIVAFWHHPPYTSGTHFSDTERELVEMRVNALPLLESYGADLVLAGHSHVYERSFLINGHYGKTNTFSAAMKLDGSLGREEDLGPYRKPAGGLGASQGTVYIVCGCSGQGGTGNSFFYGQQPCMVRSLSGFGSMVMQFNGLRVDVKFLRPDGTFEDYFAIDKSQPGTVRPALRVAASSGGAVLSWPTSVPSFVLEHANALPTNLWQMVTNAPTQVGRRHQVTLPFTSSNDFFRLRSGP